MDPANLTDEQLTKVLDGLWSAWRYCKDTNNPRRRVELETSITIAEKEQARRQWETNHGETEPA